ncbi:DUF4142 domain-containing protein [Ramlibacter sp. Leaf400]|uniref:DUF4142 domain-containing protein n=1 Tax=Ramlibacter sp. Leaf400 TaxID=1736365 RepID=UPI0012E38909|nr:DUF4142 domain-containing protein [Ramlibacter sp. Leaf400]
MVSRRWMWALAGAAAALWLARSARAETEAEYFQGPYAPRAQAQAPGSPASAAAAKAAARPAAKASAPARTAAPATPRYPGYAAESARTATRLPPEERQARDFLRTAALHARFEVEAARLALKRSDNPGVRTFASELLQDHEAADAELVQLLAARGMAPPMMDNVQRKALNRLGRLSGSKFDREFVERVGRDRQREDVQQYEKAAATVDDPVIKAWIDRQLPTLRQQQSSAAGLGSWDGRRGEAPRPRPVGTREASEGRKSPAR